jgi:hypothetical protein
MATSVPEDNMEEQGSEGGYKYAVNEIMCFLGVAIGGGNVNHQKGR